MSEFSSLLAGFSALPKSVLFDARGTDVLTILKGFLNRVIQSRAFELHVVIYLPDTEPTFEDTLEYLTQLAEKEAQLELSLVDLPLSPTECSQLRKTLHCVYFQGPDLDVLYQHSLHEQLYLIALEPITYPRRKYPYVHTFSAQGADSFECFIQTLPLTSPVLNKFQLKKSRQLSPQDCQRVIETHQEIQVWGLYFRGRSGTFFVHSLLDSHPEIMTFPLSTIGAFFDFWQVCCEDIFRKFTLNTAGELNRFARLFVSQFEQAFNTQNTPSEIHSSLEKMGPNRDEYIEVNTALFHTYLMALGQAFLDKGIELSRREVFLLIHWAYDLCVHGKQQIFRKKTILFHHHISPPHVSFPQILEAFPNYQALGLTRSPIHSFYSILKHQILGQSHLKGTKASGALDLSNTLVDGGYSYWYRQILGGLTGLTEHYGIPVTPLALESLHLRPKQTLKSLCQSLGIRWSPSLLESTFNGIPYAFQNVYQPSAIEGFSYARVCNNQYESHFSERDKKVLESLLLHRENASAGELPPACLTEAISLPTQLEEMTYLKAQRLGNEKLKMAALLNYVERTYSSYKFLLGEKLDATWFHRPKLMGALLLWSLPKILCSVELCLV